MSLAIYMDVHVPAAVTSSLRERSINVLTSQDDGTRQAADESLLERAALLDRLFFTQDADFLSIAAEWQRAGREFPGVFFAQQGIAIGRLVADLELYLTCCTADELRNKVVYLPIR